MSKILPEAEGSAGDGVVAGDLTALQAGPRHGQTHGIRPQSAARPEERETGWDMERLDIRAFIHCEVISAFIQYIYIYNT